MLDGTLCRLAVCLGMGAIELCEHDDPCWWLPPLPPCLASGCQAGYWASWALFSALRLLLQPQPPLRFLLLAMQAAEANGTVQTMQCWSRRPVPVAVRVMHGGPGVKKEI